MKQKTDGSALLPKWFRTSSALLPQRFRTNSALLPHYFRTTSALLPQRFRTYSAILPHNCRNGEEPPSGQRRAPAPRQRCIFLKTNNHSSSSSSSSSSKQQKQPTPLPPKHHGQRTNTGGEGQKRGEQQYSINCIHTLLPPTPPACAPSLSGARSATSKPHRSPHRRCRRSRAAGAHFRLRFCRCAAGAAEVGAASALAVAPWSQSVPKTKYKFN